MNSRRLLLFVLAALIALAGLILIGIALLPFGALKGLADALVRDANFKSLNEGNALVFRLLLATVGLMLLGIACLVAARQPRHLEAWLRQFGVDSRDFSRGLRPSRSEAGSLLALLLILVVALLFRLPHMQESMTHDESYTYVVFSSGSLFNTVTNYQLPNNHVLNSILIYLSTHLLGNEPWTVRLPALLAGLLVVPACYALGKAIYDRYTGLAGALLVAILPGAILISTLGRGYSLVALFTLLALWLANYVRIKRNLLAWSLLVICCALGFYSVPVMLFPFGMIFAWLFLENLVAEPGPYGSKMSFLKYWFAAGVATAVFVLVLYTPIFIYTGVGKVFVNQFVVPEPWEGYIDSLPHLVSGVWQRWLGNMPPVFGILFIAGFLLSAIFHRRLSRQRFPLQAATFIWLAAIVLIRRPQDVTKIWAFLEAPFMIWVAAGTVGLLKDLRFKSLGNISAASIVVTTGLLGALVMGASYIPALPGSWTIKGAEEKTVLALKNRLGEHDLILVDSDYGPAVWYYSRLHGIAPEHFDSRLPFDHLFVIDARQRGQSLGAIVQSQCSAACPVDPSLAKLIANYQELDTYELLHR